MVPYSPGWGADGIIISGYCLALPSIVATLNPRYFGKVHRTHQV